MTQTNVFAKKIVSAPIKFRSGFERAARLSKWKGLEMAESIKDREKRVKLLDIIRYEIGKNSMRAKESIFESLLIMLNSLIKSGLLSNRLDKREFVSVAVFIFKKIASEDKHGPKMAIHYKISKIVSELNKHNINVSLRQASVYIKILCEYGILSKPKYKPGLKYKNGSHKRATRYLTIGPTFIRRLEVILSSRNYVTYLLEDGRSKRVRIHLPKYIDRMARMVSHRITLFYERRVGGRVAIRFLIMDEIISKVKRTHIEKFGKKLWRIK